MSGPETKSPTKAIRATGFSHLEKLSWNSQFFRAVTSGLEYLEAERKFSLDDTVIRLELERGEVSS
jgi:hypothetical protein